MVFLNKVDQVDDEELLELVEMEVRELLFRTTTSRATIFRSSRARRWRRWKTRDERRSAQLHLELMSAVDAYIPQPDRAIDKSVPDADRGRVLDLRVVARL